MGSADLQGSALLQAMRPGTLLSGGGGGGGVGGGHDLDWGVKVRKRGVVVSLQPSTWVSWMMVTTMRPEILLRVLGVLFCCSLFYEFFGSGGDKCCLPSCQSYSSDFGAKARVWRGKDIQTTQTPAVALVTGARSRANLPGRMATP